MTYLHVWERSTTQEGIRWIKNSRRIPRPGNRGEYAENTMRESTWGENACQKEGRGLKIEENRQTHRQHAGKRTWTKDKMKRHAHALAHFSTSIIFPSQDSLLCERWTDAKKTHLKGTCIRTHAHAHARTCLPPSLLQTPNGRIILRDSSVFFFFKIILFAKFGSSRKVSILECSRVLATK